ncbi:hypothetical protein ACVILL_001389 [Bradyrhizobium sp. USDA 3364]
MIPAELYQAVMELALEDGRDRATVNEAPTRVLDSRKG